MSDYDRISLSNIGDYLVSVCLTCGAVVWDRPRHDRWHEGLARAARQADSADAWTHPIGGEEES